MSAARDVLLAASVATAWLGAAAFIRLRTALEKLHAVTFVNVAALGLLVVAAIADQGITARSLKCMLIYLVTLTAGAVLSHVTAQALHFRKGERR